MIITPQILSIPPYLSTPWKNISFLSTAANGEHFKLIVLLNNRMRIVIPHMDKSSIDAIFKAHAQYSSTPELVSPSPSIDSSLLSLSGNGIDLLSSAMQHNAAQSNTPELPKEVLDKIAGVVKILGLDDPSQFPKPEPHCNCPFCQIARVFHKDPETSVEMPLEEEVSLADLTFRNWTIQQSTESNQLYLVFNPLDENEHYSVYLGDPLGCTCGHKNCEHIRAVLSS